jgi:hypothetical protein
LRTSVAIAPRILNLGDAQLGIAVSLPEQLPTAAIVMEASWTYSHVSRGCWSRYQSDEKL